MGSQELAEGIGNLFFVEGYQLVGNGLIVISEAYVYQIHPLSSLKSVKFVIAESAGDLSCTVRTEVKEDNGVMLLNQSHRLSILCNHRGNHKLIVLFFIVGSLDSGRSAYSSSALSLSQGIIGQLYTVPVFVPVHGIITAHNRSNFAYAQLLHLRLKGLHKFLSGSRRCVTAVQEAVYEYLLKTLTLCQLQQAENVGQMAVYAAIRHQAV